ncbi:MAG: NAD(P)-dependent oxidoreductase [Acidimicrobiales bacterium]|jgi:phosphoglycerate dehydrogenase-like enzyme
MSGLEPEAGFSPRTGRRGRVGLACNETVRRDYVADEDVARLEAVADFSYMSFSVDSEEWAPVPRNREAEAELARFASDLDVLLVCRGAPFVSPEVIEGAPRLSLLGELEGDRFAYRLDVEAAQRRGVRVVDTSHGSSWPAAEWALGLALVGLRNAGANFRRMIAHENAFQTLAERSGPGYDGAELSQKRVGLIGFGYLGRRLVELLRPFHVEARVFDPYVPKALAEAYDVEFGPLDKILECDVVFALVPLTASTEGMLGADELDLLRPGCVFVNVSRGKVVDSAALLARLQRGDIIACLDVFDPSPLPVDSPLLDLANVFVSPHIAGVTAESRRRFFSLMVDECLRHFAGLEPRSELTSGIVRLRSTSP